MLELRPTCEQGNMALPIRLDGDGPLYRQLDRCL